MLNASPAVIERRVEYRFDHALASWYTDFQATGISAVDLLIVPAQRSPRKEQFCAPEPCSWIALPATCILCKTTPVCVCAYVRACVRVCACVCVCVRRERIYAVFSDHFYIDIFL